MTITCIIIDDEPLARQGIENYIKRTRFLKLLGSYSIPDKIEPTLLSAVDLIFLDMKLHKKNGLDFYRTLLPDTPFAVVISAFPEFALDSFELNVADYLLKPVSFERFTESVNRVKELIRLKSDSQLFYDSQADYFFIKSNNQIQKLKYEDILYIEGLSNYVLIYTEQQKYLSYLTLNHITEKLPAKKFIRIHKSYIVPIDKVEAIKGNDVYIQGHCLPLGQSYKQDFMELIEKKLLKK